MSVNYLVVEELKKSHGDVLLFENISFGIQKGQKVALIAKNGTGKTSLLKIIAGLDTPDIGNVVFRNEIKVSYLSQDISFEPGKTIKDVVFQSSGAVEMAVEKYYQALESGYEKEIEIAHNRMDSLSAWDYEVKMKQILTKLGINDINQKVDNLSGGQEKRVALAAALISRPDFLILDEPTNHLDLDVIQWLEEYLDKEPVTLLMVTHDRYFLDRICDRILELDNGVLYSYYANYSEYIQKRQERIETEISGVEKAQNLYKRELQWIRSTPMARTGKSKYRIEAFTDVKKKAHVNTEEQKLEIDIESHRLGKKILDLENVTKSFGDICVLKDFTYSFQRFEKVGILGKNGTGKTSFLNLITNKIQADSGSIDVGKTVVFGYYTQGGMHIDEGKRVIDVIKDISEYITLGKGRKMGTIQFLEYFLFPKEKHYVHVSKISGGEKRRLYLMTVLMRNPNFLILDEPTNDLDISTLQVLESFLEDYPACVIVVSHDRFFLDKVVDHIFYFKGEGFVKDFPGNFSVFRKKQDAIDAKIRKQEQLEKQQNKHEVKKTTTSKSGKLSYKYRRELEIIEKELVDLNTEKEALEQFLNAPDNNTEKLIDAAKKYEEVKDLIDEKEMRWLELTEMGG